LLFGQNSQKSQADEPSAEQMRFFESSIRPVLVEHCQKCHGAEKQWGNLRLDSSKALLQGGDTSAAIVPGQPEQSLLIRAIRQTDEDLKMPPKGKLSDKQIADFVQWVKIGAPYPAAADAPKVRHRDPKHWSFQSPTDPQVPTVNQTSWPQSPLDAFILAKLEGEKLSPAAAADKRTLIRRATFDLTGLPPTPDETANFLADISPDAFSRVIERLLDSPAYGERWGRHWLDIARYADSNGLDENVAQGNAWRYRDYVVASFNQDKPYDQFVMEQLAGDLLPTDDPVLRKERLVATGFLAIGPKVLAEVDEAKMQMDIVDEQIDTVGRALLGLTLGCARCHDHKFDPIDTADYYGLAGIFKSTKTMDSFKKVAIWHENAIHTAEELKLKAAFDEQLALKKAALQQRVTAADAQVTASLPAGEKPPEKLETKYPEETKTELKRLRDELAAFEKTAPEMSAAMGVTDDAVTDVAIHIRGNPLKLGDIVPRHVPPVLSKTSPPQFTAQHSGRLELARSLVEKQHPLTSRVIVNRIWRWHFGTGLVRSMDNFGLLGQPATHPELLDWLAHRFMEQGWSIKKLHRLIMLSSTYQLSSNVDAMTAERDPENRWYGRANIRRLEAEEVRDALLAVSGKLDLTMGGSLLNVKNRAYFFDHTSKDLTDYSSVRRSLYLPIVRNNVYDVFQLLDYPDAAIPTGDRTSTTVAPQALLMMNSDLVTQASVDLAKRSLTKPEIQDADRLQRIYALSFGREATADEIAQSKVFVAEIAQAFEKTEPDPAIRQTRAWDVLCQVVLASNEFVYLR
jgi:mono/diheme cytochrome c family protein